MHEQRDIGAGETEGESETRTGSQAVDRAISVLYALGSDLGPVTVPGLAARVGLPVSTTYRLTQALVRGGLLERVAGSDAYRIGPGIWELASVATSPPIEEVAPHLHALSATIGITASLAVTDGGDAHTIYSARPPVPHCERQIPGRRLSLATSAMGQALVAFDRAPQRLRVNRFNHLNGHIGDLDAVRRRGHAEAITGQDGEITAIAVPVFDRRGRVRAAVGVQAMSKRLTPGRVTQVVPIMRRTAISTSQALERVGRS